MALDLAIEILARFIRDDPSVTGVRREDEQVVPAALVLEPDVSASFRPYLFIAIVGASEGQIVDPFLQGHGHSSRRRDFGSRFRGSRRVNHYSLGFGRSAGLFLR